MRTNKPNNPDDLIQMKYPEVKHLYKYYAYNENSLAVLINKKIWVAKPESFNDPFDCDIDFNPYIGEKTLKELSKQTNSDTEDIKQAHVETMKQLKEEFSNSGVFSMCEKDDNILVWSHYADQHKGFCIEFVRKFDNELGNIKKTKPIDYTDDYPDVSLFNSTGNINRYIFQKMFFTKARDWEYEGEWRFICAEGDKEQPIPFVISSIIFGLKMLEKNKHTIQYFIG